MASTMLLPQDEKGAGTLRHTAAWPSHSRTGSAPLRCRPSPTDDLPGLRSSAACLAGWLEHAGTQVWRNVANHLIDIDKNHSVRRHAMRMVTTRRDHPGADAVDVRINGQVLAEAGFSLALWLAVAMPTGVQRRTGSVPATSSEATIEAAGGGCLRSGTLDTARRSLAAPR